MLDTPRIKIRQASRIGEFSAALTDVVGEPVPARLENLAMQLDDAIKQRLTQKEPA